MSDSLLQQFNFGEPAVESEEAATEPKSEVEPDEEDQLVPSEAEGLELEAHSSTEKGGRKGFRG